MSTKFTDQEYLSTDQYKDASNLDARAQLHERFSTNSYGWQRWVFDQFKLASNCRILELGGGPCYLWRDNAHRIPAGWDMTLTDLTSGMVQQAQQNLRDVPHPFRFGVVDAQAIPFPNAHFDAVIANHMLYHVPDRAQALAEIRRVLKPGGRFYTATNGRGHLSELKKMTARIAPDAGLLSPPPDFFCLEAGQDELAGWFSHVAVHRYEDALVVTEAAPLMAYIRSSITAAQSPPGDAGWAELTTFVEQELARHGAIHITKDPGLFEAW